MTENLLLNLLFYGDNIDVLSRHIESETVDLIYLDPPFKSNQDYNILFAERMVLNPKHRLGHLRILGTGTSELERHLRYYYGLVEEV